MVKNRFWKIVRTIRSFFSKKILETPVLAPERRTLFLSSSHEAYDLEIDNGKEKAAQVKPGVYRWHGLTSFKCRPPIENEWSPIDTASVKRRNCTIAPPSPTTYEEISYVGLLTPDSLYLKGEKIELQFLPARAGIYEVELKDLRGLKAINELTSENHYLFKDGLPAGEYRVRVRWIPPLETERAEAWTAWSIPTKLTVHPKSQLSRVEELRIYEHKLSLISDRDVWGVLTVTDPWALPPSCPESEPIRWFRTPCYEGMGTLLNEHPDYYRDPFSYYLDCIQQLKDRGIVFRTWHDILDGNFRSAEREVLIQFDVDAGPLSMERIYRELVAMGVCATIMIHRKCHDWYEYTIDELNIDYLKEAEQNGWTIGYHNNSITNVQRLDQLGDYGPDVLEAAKRCFREDVQYLRQWFNIKTFSHHGGNTLNKLTPIPGEDLDLVCVDKSFNRPLWKLIRSSFSDGGFMSRPCNLRDKIRIRLIPGLQFFRNHPVKYGNYTLPFDVPPLQSHDAISVGCEVNQELIDWIASETEKQNLWLKLRNQHRLARRLSYASSVKPISHGFNPFSKIQALAEKFRARRRPHFLREYPWIQGDPRVFWWKMLDAYAPKEGEILNVGALPSDQREETTAFVSSQVRVVEMDIDPKREPDFICDITTPPHDFCDRFEGVLLLGLPYFHSPSKAIKACARITRTGGMGLFGFAADTHPSRGGVWKPKTRPVWRKELEPLKNIGLKGLLWSFDQECIETLFLPWDNVQIESFSHYWFVVCRKGSI